MQNNKTEKSGKATMYTVSVVAVLIVCGLILYLSGQKPDPKPHTKPVDAKTEETADSSAVMTGEEYLASSDAIAGETSNDIDRRMTADQLSGKYIDERDDWCYQFEYAPSDNYDGTFYAAFKNVIESETGEILVGNWKLENGEIKLFSEDEYLESLWACQDYIIDSKAFFVGEINPDAQTQQTMFVCKDSASGEVRKLNLYDDGNVIFEFTTLSDVDASSDASAASDGSQKQLLAGTYVKNGDVITVTIGDAATDYKIVDGGLASWVYVKSVD